MKIKYLGPGNFVIVDPYGEHIKGAAKEYPDDFGENLIATSKKQKFVLVDVSVDNGPAIKNQKSKTQS